MVVMTARPGRIAAEIRIDAPEPRDESFRTSAEYAGYCREVSNALAPSYAGQSGMSAPQPPSALAGCRAVDSRAVRLVRILLPIVVLAARRRGMGTRGAAQQYPALCAAGPGGGVARR